MEINYDELKKNLLKELSLDGLPAEKQEEFMNRIMEALLKRIFLSTMDRLGEAGIDEYEALLERKATEEEVEAFFETKIPDYESFVKGLIEEFKEAMKKESL